MARLKWLCSRLSQTHTSSCNNPLGRPRPMSGAGPLSVGLCLRSCLKRCQPSLHSGYSMVTATVSNPIWLSGDYPKPQVQPRRRVSRFRLSYTTGIWTPWAGKACDSKPSPFKAFDTVDRKIPLRRLLIWIGMSGTALRCVKSYLKDRTLFVSIGF